MTQTALAQRTFCSVETVKKMEAGERVPSQELARLLADTLAVPAAEREAFVRYARGERTKGVDFASAPAGDLTAPWRKSAPAYRLPRTLTALVGRERELQTACALLRRPDVALLTLSGPPGAGKTRLSLAIAHAVADDFADGICFVPLASVHDPALVPAAIAEALGMRDAANLPPVVAVPEHLRDKHLLLVLDNFEQVVPAAPVVTELLAAAHSVKALVTSREVLKIYGEQEFPVPPLSLPDLRHLPSPDALRMYAAVELFTQRAQAVQRDFALTPANSEAVARICAWLDGLPLAIEMAAARIKWYTPQALLAQLSARLATLVDGPRDLSPRQQTLRGAIDWSYDLLSADERRVFEQMSVFAGGATLEAAREVLTRDGRRETDDRRQTTAGIGGTTVAEGQTAKDKQETSHKASTAVFGHPSSVLLHSLVEKSLLVYEAREAGEPRYAMLETMREYATAKLAEHHTVNQIHTRHLRYFLALAERAQPHLTEAPSDWWPRMNAERDNLRSAMEWALQDASPEVSLRLAAALAPFWYYTNALREGAVWFRRVLDINPMVRPELHHTRTRVVQAYGVFVRLGGNYLLARQLLREAVEGLRAEGATAGTDLAFALLELSRLAFDQGDWAEMRATALEGEAIYRQLQQPAGIARALGQHGNWALAHADYEMAERYFNEALALAGTTQNTSSIVTSHRHLGDLARCRADYASAEAHYRQALRLNSTIDDPYTRARLLRLIGTTVIQQEDTAQGLELLTESLSLYQHLGNRGSIRWVLAALAGLEAHRNHPDQAMRLLGAMDTLAHEQQAALAPPDSTEYESTLALVATQAEPARLAAWRAEGRALTFERAIEMGLALKG